MKLPRTLLLACGSCRHIPDTGTYRAYRSFGSLALLAVKGVPLAPAKSWPGPDVPYLSPVEFVELAVKHADGGEARVDPEVMEAALALTALSGDPVSGLAFLAERRTDGFMIELRQADFIAVLAEHLA